MALPIVDLSSLLQLSQYQFSSEESSAHVSRARRRFASVGRESFWSTDRSAADPSGTLRSGVHLGRNPWVVVLPARLGCWETWNRVASKSDATLQLPPLTNGRDWPSPPTWRPKTDIRALRATGGKRLSICRLSLSPALYSSPCLTKTTTAMKCGCVCRARIIAPSLSTPSLPPPSPRSPFWPHGLPSTVSPVHPIHWYLRRQWRMRRWGRASAIARLLAS